ncbi:CPBP family intramembrane glutamic endopeptidase [Liquorilactobacillus uvarum]|uniref:CPBP family intramembrane glutamic endopeptidase n=1 Tax=Liquorilactobacillus uvarum TaxID=303240 RepID=UPI00288AB06C|nr:CPBP family intramembrane glutamic endopeptidase [Liquorilactobacillus uvarum]
MNYFLTKQVIYFKFKISPKIIKLAAVIPVVFFIFFIKGSKRIPETFIVGVIGAVPEEYLFRGIILGKILKLLSIKLNNKRMSIIISIILSSLIFGSMHAINLMHQPLLFTVAQMIQTFGLVMLLAAVYIKSGSIIFPMLIHFSLDSMVILIVGYSKAMMGVQHVSILSTGIMLFLYTIVSVGVMANKHENILLSRL